MIAVFILAHQLPGGPFDYAGEKQLPASVVKNLERKYHLDDPVYLQMVHWIWDALRGDLGPSFFSRTRTVNEIIMQTFPISWGYRCNETEYDDRLWRNVFHSNRTCYS
jgi:oligopeptide transport system permease protein